MTSGQDGKVALFACLPKPKCLQKDDDKSTVVGGSTLNRGRALPSLPLQRRLGDVDCSPLDDRLLLPSTESVVDASARLEHMRQWLQDVSTVVEFDVSPGVDSISVTTSKLLPPDAYDTDSRTTTSLSSLSDRKWPANVVVGRQNGGGGGGCGFFGSGYDLKYGYSSGDSTTYSSGRRPPAAGDVPGAPSSSHPRGWS